MCVPVALGATRRYRTNVVPKCLEPSWDDADFPFRGPSIDATEVVRIDVYDKDDLSRDDLLGTAEIPVVELWGRDGEPIEGWYHLFSDGAPAGQVHVCMQVTGAGARLPRRVSTYLRVWDMSARRLRAADRGGTSDPYAVVVCGDLKKRWVALVDCRLSRFPV